MKGVCFSGIRRCLGIGAAFLSAALLQAEETMYWPVMIGDMYYARMEVALEPEARVRGLMHRESLPYDGGMLFVFKEERLLSFWMKNTLIPLDIIFVNSRGTVTAVHTMKTEPARGKGETEAAYEQRLPGYSSRRAAIAAIELNAGAAASVKVGDRLELFLEQLEKKVGK